MALPAWVWALTIAVLCAVVVVDLTLAIRNPHRPSMKEAAIWSSVYIAAAFVFAGAIFLTQGATFGGEFLAGFLTEKALSVDNLFVFLLIIQAFRVPEELQSRVLLVGIVLSIVLRSVFIALGSILIANFSWVFLIFGAILIWTAWGLLRGSGEEESYEPNRFMRWAERRLRVAPDYDHGRLLTRIDGRRFVTPMMLAMLAIGSTDILFALDSIPAIFGLTQEPYLVWTATIFALFGLRQLYFLLAALLKHLAFLALGLSAILGWIGIKLLINGLIEYEIPVINDGVAPDLGHVPTWLSLGFIAVVLAAVVVANWIMLRREGRTWADLFADSSETKQPERAGAGRQ
ncbi:TerC/Alx family metal homeostasis membrane protein [Glycomyces salinus]|uniref:TerC/Alx family metal homeostasis membrane protein n=1 Tax=Glycomyces salinus TaxID=980294 RepID=UPI0018ED77B3|nr:TerC/Alx family metal homeostasis membrane protein [Glycomyces salinus]